MFFLIAKNREIVYFICVVKPEQKTRQKIRLFGVMILSALLLVLVFFNSVPLHEVLASNTMDCCKGLAHGVDSCANGICPMSSKPKSKRKTVENFCGAKKPSAQTSFLANLQKLREVNQAIFPASDDDRLGKQSNVPVVDIFVASTSCSSDGCINSVNFRNHRGFTTISEIAVVSQKPRPPTGNAENNFSQSFAKVIKTIHRECKPRTPPQIFS